MPLHEGQEEGAICSWGGGLKPCTAPHQQRVGFSGQPSPSSQMTGELDYTMLMLSTHICVGSSVGTGSRFAGRGFHLRGASVTLSGQSVRLHC